MIVEWNDRALTSVERQLEMSQSARGDILNSRLACGNGLYQQPLPKQHVCFLHIILLTLKILKTMTTKKNNNNNSNNKIKIIKRRKGVGQKAAPKNKNKKIWRKRKKKSRLNYWGVQRQLGLEGCQGHGSCVLYWTRLYVAYDSFLLTIKKDASIILFSKTEVQKWWQSNVNVLIMFNISKNEQQITVINNNKL